MPPPMRVTSGFERIGPVDGRAEIDDIRNNNKLRGVAVAQPLMLVKRVRKVLELLLSHANKALFYSHNKAHFA